MTVTNSDMLRQAKCIVWCLVYAKIYKVSLVQTINIVKHLCQIRAYVGDDPEYDDNDEDTDDLPSNSDSHGIEIEIEKTGNNTRRIRSRVGVQASLQVVWDILTDYERLADFIPGLAVSKLLEKRDNFARLFQVFSSSLTSFLSVF